MNPPRLQSAENNIGLGMAFDGIHHTPEAVDLDLYKRLAHYDTNAPQAEHLRERQMTAVANFCETSSAMLRGDVPFEGMSVIHPTGSGKTLVEAEMIRIVTEGNPDHRAVVLVPSLQILGQALGTAHDLGDMRRQNPNTTIGRYTGEVKTTGNQITVMNYHMLRTALESGDWKRINPSIVIADEIQHLIDGAWADAYTEATRGVLNVGFSATPAYSEVRDSSKLFPVRLDHMTMMEGIRSGVLAELQGFTYQGSSRIKLRRDQGDYSDEDVFSAVIGSKDNYLAAAICAKEVAQGNRGIVSCAPGYDRLHAKVVARILSQTEIETPDGKRPIVAAHVDGSMSLDQIEDILSRYHSKKAEIDVITFVGLLLEGWNSPLTDFGVWLRATPSKVLAEQRLGRLLRKREGKTARVHEILYQIDGPKHQQQVTYNDVLAGTPGHKFSVQKLQTGQRNRKRGSPDHVDPNMLSIDSNVSEEVAQQKPVSVGDTLIKPEKEEVPAYWSTIHVLATTFDLSREEVSGILQKSNVETLVDESEQRRRTFYSPDSYAILAEYSGVELQQPEDHLTVNELLDYCRYSDKSLVVNPEDLVAHLRKQGIEPGRCLKEQDVVKIFPESVIYDALDGVPGVRAARIKRRKYEAKFEPRVDAIKWLGGILTDPRLAETKSRRRSILLGQNCLLKALDSGPLPTVIDRRKLEADVQRLGIEASPQMGKVMQAKRVDLIHLIVAANVAKQEWLKLTA